MSVAADLTTDLAVLAIKYGRPITSWIDNGDGTRTAVFVPPLDATEQEAFDDLTVIVALGLPLTLAEYRARKADIAGIKAYMALASPTATQTRDAFRALVRVVGAMLKIQLS